MNIPKTASLDPSRKKSYSISVFSSRSINYNLYSMNSSPNASSSHPCSTFSTTLHYTFSLCLALHTPPHHHTRPRATSLPPDLLPYKHSGHLHFMRWRTLYSCILWAVLPRSASPSVCISRLISRVTCLPRPDSNTQFYEVFVMLFLE